MTSPATPMKEFHWAGDHGEDYPVKAGQVWAVGGHILVCSDLMASDLFDIQLNNRLPMMTGSAVLYCDPPWGQGLVNSFRTKAGLPAATYRWEELYTRIASLGHDRGLPVWLEGSKPQSRDGRKIPDLIARPTGYGRYWDIEYASHSPAGLYYFSTREPAPPQLNRELIGMHDRDTPAAVMSAYGSIGVVIEPCCGLGGTPLNAQKVGWLSVNNEINPYRMSTALWALSRAANSQPRRVI